MLQIEEMYTTKKLNKMKIVILCDVIIVLILFIILLILLFITSNESGETVVKSSNGNILPVIIEKAEEIQLAQAEEIQFNQIEKSNTVYLPPEPVKYVPMMSEIGMNNIDNIYNLTEKRIFLTFDDGPSPNVTVPILDYLKQENIKATFFVLGSMVERYPNIVKRAYDEGHYIANHGYSHIYKKIYSSPEEVLNEYNQTEKIIADAIGIENYSTHLFRFPGGSVGGWDAVKKSAKTMFRERNIAFLDWNCLTKDSEGNFTKDELLQNAKDTSINKDSIVLLCHDTSSKKLSYEVLPDIVAYFREQGYKFADMRDLII